MIRNAGVVVPGIASLLNQSRTTSERKNERGVFIISERKKTNRWKAGEARGGINEGMLLARQQDSDGGWMWR